MQRDHVVPIANGDIEVTCQDVKIRVDRRGSIEVKRLERLLQ